MKTTRAHGGDAVPRAGAVARSVRDLAIDRYRGLLVILMVGGDFLGGIRFVPAFLKHAPDIGLTIADTVAPAFVFVVGLNYGPSFARRFARAGRAAYAHFVMRYLVLIGIGGIISAGTTLTSGVVTDWGVLQAIGAAGLICLPFLRLPVWSRIAVGLTMLVLYQFVMSTMLLAGVLGSVQGGLFGSIAWGALLVLSTAVADLRRAGLLPYVVTCAVASVVGGLSTVVVPVSKHRVSLSFVLVSLAIAAAGFLLAELGSHIVRPREGVLVWWGQNPLVMYLLHLLLLGVVVLPAVSWWYFAASPVQAAAQLVVILGIMSVTAWWAHRRGVRVTL